MPAVPLLAPFAGGRAVGARQSVTTDRAPALSSPGQEGAREAFRRAEPAHAHAPAGSRERESQRSARRPGPLIRISIDSPPTLSRSEIECKKHAVSRASLE